MNDLNNTAAIIAESTNYDPLAPSDMCEAIELLNYAKRLAELLDSKRDTELTFAISHGIQSNLQAVIKYLED